MQWDKEFNEVLTCGLCESGQITNRSEKTLFEPEKRLDRAWSLSLFVREVTVNGIDTLWSHPLQLWGPWAHKLSGLPGLRKAGHTALGGLVRRHFHVMPQPFL